ncbi:MAG: adenylate/guanylate cyclase domain-containing protein [Candidatus Latescibacterota bacterium]
MENVISELRTGKSNKKIALKTLLLIFSIQMVAGSVALVTFTTYIQAKELARDEIRKRLVTAVRGAAQMINIDQHAKIKIGQNGNDLNYISIQQQVREIRNQMPDVRYVYTFRKNSAGEFVFISDSDNSKEMGRLGDIYKNATPTMNVAYSPTGQALAEEHFSEDKWGTWLSGYAPLVKKDGSLEGIIGLDIESTRVLAMERRYLFVGITSALVIFFAYLPFMLLLAHLVSKPIRSIITELKLLREFKVSDNRMRTSRITEVDELCRVMDSTKKGLKSFQKYIPEAVVEQLISTSTEARQGATKREITILFTDFEDFTALTERTPPDELVAMINEYLDAVSTEIAQHGGTIDKFIGDSVMAFWNAPQALPDHPAQASLAALAITNSIEKLNARRSAQGHSTMKIRIGLHTGIAMVGNIGSNERLNYTAIGDSVNVSSRLEQLNKEHNTQILISATTAERLSNEFQTRFIENSTVKGKTRSIGVYELITHTAKTAT